MIFEAWLHDRLALQEILDDVGSKFITAHVNIFYGFGIIVITDLLLQAATGFALTFYYRPSVSDALTSVRAMYILVGWFAALYCMYAACI